MIILNKKKRKIKKNHTGDGINAVKSGWTFGKNIPKKFDVHVKKSVPFYDEGQFLIKQLSDFFIKDKSVCYDIGTATGNIILNIYHEKKKAQYIGIDLEKRMIDEAKKKIKKKNIKFIVSDLNKYKFKKKSDFITSYYTLQFIEPRYRQNLINKIYKTLNWGGCFIVFEKVRGPDARFQDILSSLYVEYKISQGYDENEILSKSRSLKGVLEPFSSRANIEMFKRAGFKDILTIFKYTCFEGFLCIK